MTIMLLIPRDHRKESEKPHNIVENFLSISNTSKPEIWEGKEQCTKPTLVRNLFLHIFPKFAVIARSEGRV